jgi:hypothetical protein
MTIPEAPTAEISLLLPEVWFSLPLNPAPNPADLQIEGWDEGTITKFTALLTLLGEKGKAANITTAAAAIYDVGGEVTVTSVAAGYQRFSELMALGEHDMTDIFTSAGTTDDPEAAQSSASLDAATESSEVSSLDLPIGPAARRQRSIFISDDHPSTIIIDFVIRPTATPDTAVTLSFSAFGARPEAFVGLFDGLATGLHVMGGS